MKKIFFIPALMLALPLAAMEQKRLTRFVHDTDQCIITQTVERWRVITTLTGAFTQNIAKPFVSFLQSLLDDDYVFSRQLQCLPPLPGLLCAIMSHDTEKVRCLVQERPHLVTAVDDVGRSALLFASCYGHLDLVRFLLERGAEVNRGRDTDNTAPLHLALLQEHEDVVGCLLQQDGVNVGVRNKTTGRTPLHIAVLKGLVPSIRLLLSKGADVTLRDANGLTPADCARNLIQQARQEALTPEAHSAMGEIIHLLRLDESARVE